jgi:hypothetical protein
MPPRVSTGTQYTGQTFAPSMNSADDYFLDRVSAVQNVRPPQPTIVSDSSEDDYG